MNPYETPGSFAGMSIIVVDAQRQARTARDVRGPWVRPKVPNKRTGRKGTRRQFKRANPPHHRMLYREPADVMVIEGRTIIATGFQAEALWRAATPRW